MNRLAYTLAALAVLSGGATALTAGAQDEASRRIRRDFDARMESAADSRVTEFFSTADFGGSEEREALEFLYAYMPWPDMVNREPGYFLENVRLSLEARKEMPWGDSVPDREFRHFVLPVRVNNEDLDDSRRVFFGELRDRVKGLPMRQAILEVNHWCHEKATYRPSDARTSTPLSTVSQAIGRCGEESTFTVAALRAVGIPARQVYTPRWAHTDDNHAWVEAWADGRWWFLGACEPEPLLDMAWFNLPASRGMLMTTNAYGYYDGPEERIGRSAVNTTINVTQNYAPVSVKEVMVTDGDSIPQENVAVLFMLYNYGEYYPVARKLSDKDGKAALVTGMGDMVVWATDGRRCGVSHLRAADQNPVVVALDRDVRGGDILEFDIVPPGPSASLPAPSEEMVAENEARKQYEDSVRGVYTSTFATEESARAFAAETGLDPDVTAKVLVESRGNHQAIKDLLLRTAPVRRKTVLDVFAAVSEKDRRDIPMDVVTDRFVIGQQDTPLFVEYVLNPRVENEGLEPFAEEFLGIMPSSEVETYRRDPAKWAEWVTRNIAVDTVWNPGRLRVHPSAVWRVRKADALSRRIFFVASARAMGIPARIDAVTGKTQWHDDTGWHDALLDFGPAHGVRSQAGAGYVEFDYVRIGRIADPKYYTHFTISKIEDGIPRLLEFEENTTLGWISDNYRRFDKGRYILTTGQRMADGSVLARSSFFSVVTDSLTRVPFVIRQDTTGVQVIGNFNSEDLFTDADGQCRSLLSATGRGYYTLVYGAPNHEPTSHVLNEIGAAAASFEADGRKVVVLYADSDRLARAGAGSDFRLPANVVTGHDNDGAILGELREALKLDTVELPVTIIADTFNRVVYVSQGYTIGTADRILDILSRVSD